MGMIFNIQRFSIQDGPGIRTVVFFKGCTLQCLWCHNPESISFQREVELYPERCIGCGACLRSCPNGAYSFSADGTHRIDRAACRACLACAGDCFAEAIVPVGAETAASDVMKSLLQDLPYYQSSGGGVTFSGGECVAQPEFLAELLAQCRAQGIHTAVDTAGHVPWSSLERVMGDTDLFMYDLKTADTDLHKRICGAGNERILDNLRRLVAAGKKVMVRIPYIPGINDSEILSMGHILQGLAIIRVELMPYHRLGEGKYQALGLPAGGKAIVPPTEQQIQNALNALKSMGINAERA